jgi:hypothetical protein
MRSRVSTIVRCAAALATLAMLAGGCSSTPDASQPQQVALAKTELHFDLNQCQDLGGGLYKCPSADKPICSPDYNGTLECVRTGPKGSVFVQSPITP